MFPALQTNPIPDSPRIYLIKISTVVYGHADEFNTFQVIVNSAGNQSTPASLTTSSGPSAENPLTAGAVGGERRDQYFYWSLVLWSKIVAPC